MSDLMIKDTLTGGQVKVRFISADGEESALDIAIGLSAMEGAVRAGIDGIDADCGGQLSCATCHVYVDEAWLALLPPRTEDEIDLLEFVANPDGRSRLSCQIVINSNLDGMVLHIPESQI
jgi:2Fe-2S ferredoxin